MASMEEGAARMYTHIHTIRAITVGLFALSLIACNGSAPEQVKDDAQTAFKLIEGEALWRQITAQSEMIINDSIGVGWDDEISTDLEGAATLQLDDKTIIEMGPDTVISVSRPYPTETRPVIRLLFGSILVTAQSTNYRFDSYRQIPINFQIVNVDIMIEPLDTPGKFNLRFENDTAIVDVFSGLIDASHGLVQGQMGAEWRAELVPAEPMRIIPPWTPTPFQTPTFTATSTPTSTNTPTPTNTPTNTNTPRPATATFTPTDTFTPEPTDTPAPPTNPPPKPKPTDSPTPTAPPTETQRPPTDTPRPPPS